MPPRTNTVPSRSRAWVFTWNNPPADWLATVDALGARYYCVGEEVAPGTGTPHLQGYVCWHTVKSSAQVRRSLPLVHVEPRRGSHAQARTYCCKDGIVHEDGDPPMDDSERGASEIARWDLARTNAKVRVL